MKKKKIVVAEDERLMRQAIVDELTEIGYEVVAFDDGLDVIAHVVNDRPDAILLDVNMPVLTGIETLERIRTKSDLANVPIALLTAANEVDVVRKAIALGVSDYLIKPFTKAALTTRVADLTFSVTLSDVRQILPNLRQADVTLFRAPGLSALNQRAFNLYPAVLGERSLCVAVTYGIAPAALLKADDQTVKGAVEVYVKRMQVWRKLPLAAAA